MHMESSYTVSGGGTYPGAMADYEAVHMSLNAALCGACWASVPSAASKSKGEKKTGESEGERGSVSTERK